MWKHLLQFWLGRRGASADGPSMHLSDRRLHFLQFYLLFLLSITQFGLVGVVDHQLVVVILFYVLILIDVFELHGHDVFQPFFVNQPDVPRFYFRWLENSITRGSIFWPRKVFEGVHSHVINLLRK